MSVYQYWADVVPGRLTLRHPDAGPSPVTAVMAYRDTEALVEGIIVQFRCIDGTGFTVHLPKVAS